MLRKMNLNKTEITDDDGTAAAPLAERRRWHELSVLYCHTDHVTCDETLMRQPAMLFAAC